MKKFIGILGLLIFHFHNSIAINAIEWVDYQARVFKRIDLKTKTFQVKKFNGVWEKQFEVKFDQVNVNEIPSSCTPLSFNRKNKVVISIPGTGQVYQFDQNRMLLERIDKTFFRGYNFYALQYLKNDTLYSLGGEGFWRSNSVLSYFDFKYKEWEEIRTFGEIPKGVLSLHAGIDPTQSKVIALEAFQQGDYHVSHLGYYELDLPTRIWRKKGRVDLSALKKLGQSTANFVMLGHFLFLNDLQIGYFVDTEENKLYKYIGPKKRFFLFESELFSQANQIFSKQRNKNIPGDNFTIDSMAVSELKRDSQLIGHFYSEEPLFTNFDYLVIVISICLLISLGVNFRFMFKKIKPSQDPSLPSIPIGGKAFIELFKVYGEDYLVSTEEISIILGCEKKAFDTQRQYRAQFINAMNQYFVDHYQIEEAVYRKADEEDKRFIKYGLKNAAFIKLC